MSEDSKEDSVRKSPAAPVAANDGLPGAAPGKALPAAAVRALKEAQERRAAARAAEERAPNELGGPKGEEPTRYGDWERGGRAIDF